MNKLVRESISFERSKDPKDAMGISKIEKIKKDLEPYIKDWEDINNLNDLLTRAAERGF